jgi:hypothetical protein
MPPWEAKGPKYYDQDGQMQEGGPKFVYQPFITTDLLNWKYHSLSFMEKPQV